MKGANEIFTKVEWSLVVAMHFQALQVLYS